MKVGIPRGLLFYKYHPFVTTFFNELGAEIVLSPDTNKEILNLGTKTSVDEACLPIKIFHGHVLYLKNKCDIILIPRIMQLNKNEYICPKFCGLPEMVINNVGGIKRAISYPIYAYSSKSLSPWVIKTGLLFTKNYFKILKAYRCAIEAQKNFISGIHNRDYKIKIALVGHPYNIYDNFTNMNLVDKLNNLGVGVITEEFIDEVTISNQIKSLYKKPFWTFTKNSYGFSTYIVNNDRIRGIIYISSFACGIDSVTIELIKSKLKDFPLLVLKIDEHTGEAGLNTRLEAFVDMLQRRCG